MLSSRGDETGKVAALDAGADDYVTKPFGAERADGPPARRACATACSSRAPSASSPAAISASTWCAGSSAARPRTSKLSPKEYDILEQLVIHAGKVLTHRHLLREVWRDESVDPQYLRVYVRQLRQKIEADPSSPRHVLTEPGVGYRLV